MEATSVRAGGRAGAGRRSSLPLRSPAQPHRLLGSWRRSCLVRDGSRDAPAGHWRAGFARGAGPGRARVGRPACSVCRAQEQDVPVGAGSVDLDLDPPSRAEDAAVFSLADQQLSSWVKFSALLASVGVATFFLWINPDTGFGDDYVNFVSGISSDPQVVMIALLVLFGCVHSGLAALRPRAEALVGKRAYRVVFAASSLVLAISTLSYFINHRYAGVQLWQLQGLPGIHSFVWVLNFVSFFFLYPSTFNLLEVAAIDEPELHLWETGVIRITRHPQMVGQLLWCLGHTLWTGNSFMCVTSFGLMAYHLFGCWHGDQRLRNKFGEDFEKVKARTSTWPFVAVLEGRQTLPSDYWREWARAPYLAITVFTLGAYLAHPLMQRASYALNW